MTDTDKLTRAVLRVGDGRGFVVECLNHLGGEERIVITAAHCLEHARLGDGSEGLPPCHPHRYLAEEIYSNLLGPLGLEPTVWATCLYVDPIADIAVLGQPDNQELSDEADAYGQLMENMTTLAVADAPAQGYELLTFGEHQFRNPTPGKCPARVLSLDGRWLEGHVERRAALAFQPEEFIVCGMSGSPIIDTAGGAIGVVSTEQLNPIIVDCLSARFVRQIAAAAQRELVEASE